MSIDVDMPMPGLRQALGELSMEDEGERVLAWPADLVELRPHASEDLRGPRQVGAEFVHVGFARPFNFGEMSQLVAAWTGERVEMALDADLHASPLQV